MVSMDVISPLLTDPASPRLTTYTDAGRMELSGESLRNWQSKVANLLLGLGADPTRTSPSERPVVVLDAEPGWQPVTIAIGAWLAGAIVVDATDPLPGFLSDATPPIAAFTDSVEHAAQLADEGIAGGEPIEEVFVLSTDPFGRGVEESGGDLPFGLNDFSPELRVQPDDYLGPKVARSADDSELANLVLAAGGGKQFTATDWVRDTKAHGRIVCGPWAGAVSLAQTLLPWSHGGSVVMSTDSSEERLAELASKENGKVL